MEDRTLRKTIGLLAGIGVALDYATLAYTGNMAAFNPATFLMWTLLDAVIFISMIRAGNREAYLIGSYCIGAALIAGLSFCEGQWHWGLVESLCAVGVVLTLMLLIRAGHQKAGARVALVASVLCMVIACIPTICQYYLVPASDGWWFWAVAAVCSAITALTTRPRTIERILFPIASFLVSGAITGIVLS